MGNKETERKLEVMYSAQLDKLITEGSDFIRWLIMCKKRSVEKHIVQQILHDKMYDLLGGYYFSRFMIVPITDLTTNKACIGKNQNDFKDAQKYFLTEK